MPKPKITGRVVRAGCQVMELDTANDPLVFDPKTWSKKKRAERQETIDYMRRVGRVSMIEVGPDKFRTPNREERRRAGIRRVKR